MLTKLARYLLRNDENFKKLDTELDKPEVWDIYQHYTLNHKDGFELWMANGICSFSFYSPEKIQFSLCMKLALWKKAKKIQRIKQYEKIPTISDILNQIKP